MLKIHMRAGTKKKDFAVNCFILITVSNVTAIATLETRIHGCVGVVGCAQIKT